MVFNANLAARTQTITDAQRYLLREWHVPEWARRGPVTTVTPSPTPNLGDPLAHWITYYDQHQRAPCPIGVHRDPNGNINADLLRGHLFTVNLIGSGPRRNHLRREGQLALAGLLIDAEVYHQQLNIHGVQPQGPLAAVPLPPLDLEQTAEELEPLDRLDLSVRALTIQCARSGVTPGLVTSFLATWARSFIEACPAPQPTPHEPHSATEEEATRASTPTDKAVDGEDTEMAEAEPLPFAHASVD